MRENNSDLFKLRATTSVTHDGTRVSGEALEDLIALQCARLQELRIGLDDRVVIHGPKSASYCALLLAIFAVGAVAVPVFAGLKFAQIKHIFTDCRPKAAFLGPYVLAQLQREFFTKDVSLEVMEPDGMNTLCRAKVDVQIPAEANAAIIYTSGSTGLPKGVVFSRSNIILSARSVAQYTKLDSSDCVLCVLPFSFDAGLISFLSAIIVGAQIILVDFVQSSQLVALCRKHAVTSITAVPGLWTKMLETDWSSAAKSVRRLCSTGGHLNAQIHNKLQDTFPGSDIYPMYGFTEAFRCSFMPPDRAKQKPGSVGRSIPYSSFAIVSDQGQLCAPNEIGELVQFGPLVTSGYWENQQNNEQKFRPVPATVVHDLLSSAGELYNCDPSHFNRVAWSGDLAKIDTDGDLYFVARRDNMIKVNGFRISPSEIEDVCVQQGCLAAFAFPLRHEGGDVIVLAYAAVNELPPTRLESKLRFVVPSYMMPQFWLQLEDVPINNNGKYCRSTVQKLVIRHLEQTAC